MEQESKQRFDSYQASKNAQANQQSNSNPSNPFGSNQNPFASAFGQPQAQSSIFPASGNSFGNSLGGGLFGQSSQQQPQNPMQSQQQSSVQPISGFLTNTPSTTANSGNNLFSGGIFGSQSQPAMQRQEPLVPQENRNVQSGSLFSSPQPFQPSNLFGSSTAGQSSIFGSNPPAPVAQNPTGTSLFGGSQQPGTSNSNSLFGGTNPPQPTTTGGLFGSNNALGGGSGGLFGNPANTASPTPSGGLFGSTINAPKPPQTSLFGSGSSNLFGQGPTTTQSNLFGGSAPTSGLWAKFSKNHPDVKFKVLGTQPLERLGDCLAAQILRLPHFSLHQIATCLEVTFCYLCAIDGISLTLDSLAHRAGSTQSGEQIAPLVVLLSCMHRSCMCRWRALRRQHESAATTTAAATNRIERRIVFEWSPTLNNWGIIRRCLACPAEFTVLKLPR